MGSVRKSANTSILVLTSFALQQLIPLALIWAPSTFADATTTSTTASPYSPQGSNFSSLGAGVTANFNSCVAAGGGNAFGAQGNQVQTLANAAGINADGSTSGKNNVSATKGGKGGAGGANGQSCGNPVIPDASSFECSSNQLGDGAGNFDPKKAESYLKTTLEGTDQGQLSCRKNELDSASKEMSCIAQQGQLLAQQIGSLSSVFQANITRFQQDDTTYKQRIGDRTSQISQINALLNGDGGSTDANGNAVPGTGREGLLKLQSDMKILTEQTLPQQITNAQNMAQSFANTGNTITQNIQYRTMSLIGNCFKNQPVNGAGYNCVPNGPNVSAEQFLECRYQQYSHVQNGVYDIRSSTDQTANSNQANLDAIFTQMFQDSPLSWVLPTDQQSSQAASTASYTATNLQAVESQFTSQLSGITINGVNLAQEANQLLAVCQAQAVTAVQNEQTSPSSFLGQSVENLYQTGTTNNSSFSQNVQTNADAWQQAMTVLSQQNLPLNLVGCQPDYSSCVSQCSGGNVLTATGVPSVSCVSTCGQTSSAQQVSCLKQLQTQLNGLYSGGSTIPNMTMNITSQFPDTAIPASALQCNSISGCIALLQQRSQEVSAAKTQLQTAEQNYVQQARQSTQQFVTMLSQALATQSNGLRSQINNLNATLRSLGISKLSQQPIQAAQLDYETDDNGKPGLPKMPTNILGLIGGNMSPPMPDVTDPNFADADGFQDAEDKVDDQQDKLSDAIAEIQSLESSCIKSANKQTLQDISSSAQTFTTMQCPAVNAACGDATTALNTVLYTLVNGTGANLNGDALRSLNGIQTSCTKDSKLLSQCVQLCQNYQVPNDCSTQPVPMPTPSNIPAGGYYNDPNFTQCTSAYNAYQNVGNALPTEAACQQILGGMTDEAKTLITKDSANSNSDQAN